MRAQDWRQGLQFVKTELHLGSTFAKAALCSTHPPRVIRNTANARLAYDSARRYVGYLLVTSAVSQELDQQFKLLRRQLVSLGESV